MSKVERSKQAAALLRERAANERPLTEHQLALIEWLVTPRSERNPSTVQGFADMVGVTKQTIYTWQRKPSFIVAWNKRVDEMAGSPDRAQAVFDAIFAKAVHGDVRAAELFLKASGRLAVTPTIDQNGAKVAELSDEELEDLIAQSANAEKEQRLRLVAGDD